MRIVEYDEVDGQQVLEMNLRCFGWYLSPDQVKSIKKVDKHVPDYFALYAVENEKVLSQVGVVEVDTQTTSGIEKIGCIWGVCTRPMAARRGLARKLMEEAHNRLIADDIRYSFLGTGKSLVAYDLYLDLGYRDLTTLSRGLKLCKQKKDSDSSIAYTSKSKNDTIVKMFKEYSNGLLGFIHRPINFLKVRKAWSWMSYNTVGIFEEHNTPIGYIIASREGKYIKILEICCPRIEDTKRCFKAFETKFKPDHMLFDWVEGSFGEEAFVHSGFKNLKDSWGILMVKNLKGRHSIKKIRGSYGISESKFQMTSVDEY